MAPNPQELSKIYHRRFVRTAAYRNRVWEVLTHKFFSRWVRPGDTVLDLGCGYGEFINNIPAATKWAMDLNPDAPRHLRPEVKFLHQDCSAAWPLPDNSLDAVFTSNFFEHLPDKECLSRTVRHALRSPARPNFARAPIARARADTSAPRSSAAPAAPAAAAAAAPLGCGNAQPARRVWHT